MAEDKFKKEILYIHHGAVPGGAPTSLKNMVQGIARTGRFSCSIYCIWPEMEPFFSTIEGVKVGHYPKTGLFTGRIFIGWSRGFSLQRIIFFILEICKSPLYILREVFFLKRKKPDIVHLNSSILWMSAVAAKICHIPIVWHIREASDDSRYNLVRLAYSWFIRKLATNVICIGPQEYAKIGGNRSDKVRTIYNSLADSYFTDQPYEKQELRRRLGLPEESFLFLSLGGMSFRKGTYQFIDALTNLPKSYAAVLVGAKPEQNISGKRLANIRHLIENLLISKRYKKYYSWDYNYRVSNLLQRIDNDRLFLVGIVDDVQPYIKACDVLVFAGTTPHSARPVYEAWALKKPVIVFDTEVMRRDVDNGVDGILVADHTSELLAEAIKRLDENPDLAKEMGKAGYQKAKKRFAMQSNNDKVLAVYKEITGENCI